ncbi:MAG: tRNA pseudouridine13 synthase [Candidatus Azotimanducaceae bacterium]|jgi:tRNA pseudouridine13 synthase
MQTSVRAFGEPLGTGKIRLSVEDFRVTELYDFEPSGDGEHLLLWVKKTGANTGWVANQLASYFNLRHFDVSYCGKKDRHAITEQWFSCWLPGIKDPDLAGCQIEGVEIQKQIWHQRKLRRGDHTGNRFVLRIRDVVVDNEAALVDRLNTIREQGFPNYFGQQRFGIDNQNLDRALELIADDEMQSRRKLDRKQKDYYLSALRSWLFNQVLSDCVEAGDWADEDELWVYGLSPHRDIEIPAVTAEFASAAAFIEKMAIKAHRRSKRVIPGQLTWQLDRQDACDDLGAEHDQYQNQDQFQLTLSFDLPVGAYATTLLQECIDIEDAHQ